MTSGKGAVLTADRDLYIHRDTGKLVGSGLRDSEAYLLAAGGHLIPADVVKRHGLKVGEDGRIEQGSVDAEKAGRQREPDMDAEKPGEHRAADPDKRAALQGAGEDPKFGDAAAGEPKTKPEPKSPGGHGAEMGERTAEELEKTGENKKSSGDTSGGAPGTTPKK